MTLKTIAAGALPVAAGVIAAGLLMYYLGNNVPILKQAQSAFDGHNSDNLFLN